MEIIRSQCNQN